MEMRMRNHYLGRRQKSTSTSTTSTIAETFSALSFLLTCFTPIRRRRSSISHYNSVSILQTIEEIGSVESAKFETTIDDLPEPILLDIFLKLPLNNVFRSKCVSKKWLNLISDPFFPRLYADRQKLLRPQFALFYISCFTEPRDPCGVGPFCHPSGHHQQLTFPLNFFASELRRRQRNSYPLQLIGSDSDILLFSELNQQSVNSYSVCNPLTCEWTKLPLSFFTKLPHYPVVGFMVDDDGEFWVVEILLSEDQRKIILRLFCSIKGKWVVKKVKCTRRFEQFRAMATVVYKGMILWTVDNCLLAFDPENGSDRCSFIDLPSEETGRCGVSCERLFYYEVSSYEQGNETPVVKVWEMIDIEIGEWILLHSISHRQLWSSDECLMQFLQEDNREKYLRWVSFNPSDSDIVFLKCDRLLATCKLSSARLEVVPCDDKQGIFYRLELYVLPLVFKPWPTSLARSTKTTNIISIGLTL